MKFILGRKMQMGQVWKEDGTVVPVTFLSAGPCRVTQVKTKEKDGYGAVQFGFEEKKHANKSIQGHLKDLPLFSVLREVRVETPALNRGDVVTAATFAVGDKVDVIGTSKGRGFQGVVKRHHFQGAPKTHGHKHDERAPGSIGAGGVQRVFKGRRMAGRMGGERVTIQNLEIMSVDAEKNLIAVKGAIPGARRALIMIQSV